MKSIYVQMKLLFAVLIFFSPHICAADMLLVGYDTASYDGGCWINNATTIDNYSWKASRFQAHASGTISYFKMRNPVTPAGCTNDSGCWALYEGGTATTPGSLKAYNCFSGYNWTAVGAGDHTFNVTNTGTNLSVTAGQWYWLVFYSYAADTSHYTNANCSVPIPAYRGSSNLECIALGKLQAIEPNIVSQTEITSNVSTPPAGANFNTPTATYMMWGVWGASGQTTDPSITAATGPIAHGGNVTINGSGFGSKNPAMPLLWDDGTSTPALGSRYDGWLPTSAQQGALYNMSYRDTPFRGISAPNSRVRYILGGAHATNTGSGAYNLGGNVALGKNITSHTYFISYYYRVDPNFDEENNPTYADNMKEIVLSNTQGSFYPDGWGAFGYADWCNSDVPDVNFRNGVKLGRMTIDPAHQSVPYACSGNNLVQHNSPINGWIKMQWEGVFNQQFDSPQYSLTTYPDGRRTYQSHYGDGLTVSESARGPWAGYPKENDLRFIGLGGFARVPRMNNGVNSFRYFAAVYMDNTHSRVMLGNNQDYAQCTIVEPQIPSVWSGNSITMSVNLGSLPDTGTAYLFVFDANNSRNAVGYPVSLGGGQENNPPGPPTGLRVLQ